MIFYLIKLITISSLLFILYSVLLKNNKTFIFNRFYLLFSLLASILFPFIENSISVDEQENKFIYTSKKYIENFEVSAIANEPIYLENTNPWIYIAIISYLLFSSLLLIRFARNLTQFYSAKLTRGNRLNKMTVFYHGNKSGIYSFFNRLYLPNKETSKSLPTSILKHELTHFKQIHSLDIILAEISIIIFWFNPAFWFYKKSIKENHEFLADQSALNSETNNNYIQTILNQLEVKNYSSLGSNFSYLSIKKRIKMIQNRNKRIQNIASTSIVLCLCTALFGLFSFKTVEIDRNINSHLINTINIDLLERPKGLPIKKDQITKMTAGFGNRLNPITKEEKLHTGIDFIADEGTEIIAVGKGKVVKAKSSKSGYGNHIVIQHNAKYSTMYAHLKSISVKEGDWVELNQVIGIIGNTGTSIKTHLHFELIENGKKIDPDISIKQ